MLGRSARRSRTALFPILLALALLPAAAPLRAQQPPETLPFFRSGQAFDEYGIDSINLYNGDVGLSVPLGPGYALGPTSYPYQLSLQSSAKVWHFSAGLCSGLTGQFAWISGDPTVGVGWSLLPGYVVKRAPLGVSPFWQYYTPDGGVHEVDLGASNPAVADDGSMLRITALPNPSNPTSFTVEFPDGTLQTFNHTYSAPSATPSSLDFRNVDFGESGQLRFGLGSIADRFGNTLVTVTWSPSNPSEVAAINLTPFGSSIAFTWTNKTVGGFTWRVLDNLVFPAPGSKQLRVQFTYLTTGTFARNSFDNSDTVSCPDSPANVSVPELSTVTFSDPAPIPSIVPFSYSFTYYGSPPASIQKQGTLRVATLPSLGTITYDYCLTASGPCNIGANCNPEGASVHCNPNAIAEVQAPDATPNCPIQGCPPPLQNFTDKSPGIATRTTFDPFSNRSVTTYYDRDQFRGLEDGQPDDRLVIRRATVTSPGNDELGPTTYARRHYFKVDSPDPFNPREAAGIEVDRRYYGGSDPTQAAVRTIINCWPGFNGLGKICGYKDGAGTINDYDFTQIGRRPPNASIVWYGATPAGQNGGNCTTAATKCKAVNNSNFDTVAGKYDNTTVTTTLPGGVTRNIQTNWTPSTATGHYILDLLASRFTWDGTTLPSGVSDGQTAVRQYFDFDPTNGFLKGSRIWDSAVAKTIMDCRYSALGNGTVSGEFTQSYVSAGEPVASNCPISMPSIPSDSDTFGRENTWTNLLLTKSSWRSGTGSIGWNETDLARDGATGFVTETRDPNYPTNSALKTTYSYDSLGRILSIQPPGGSSVEWPTTLCYLPGTSGFTPFVIVKKTTATPLLNPNDANGICKRDEGAPGSLSGPIEAYNYDGLGRLVREARRSNHKFTGATYFARRDTRYDAAGHVRILSDWQACPHDGSGQASDTSVSACALPKTVPALDFPGHNLWLLNFDPFGRSQQFGNVDQANVAADVFIDRTDPRVSPNIPFSDTYELSSTLCVNGVWSVSTCNGGVTSNTATEADALGRITKVTEPHPTTGALSTDTTSYTHNVLDKLYQVTQGAQNRTFQYYAFGHLKSAKTPEDGATGNGTSTYFYGSIGNIRITTDGGIQTNYTTDPAGRVTWVTTGSSFDQVGHIVNCYDGTGVCGDLATPNFGGGNAPKGRLTRRVNINHIPFQAAAVFDDFTYSSPGARVSALTTSIGQRGMDLTKNGFGPPVTQGWTYNTLGAIATHIQPRPAGSATTLTVNDSAFTSGYLTSITATRQGGVTQQILSANYQESGRLADYTTGSATPNVKTTIVPGSVIPSRPASFASVSTSAGTLFSSGLYGYDGAGNVKTIGASADSFAYDARSRLTSAFYAGAGGGTQGFTYDRYGNLTAKTGINAVTLSTSTSTNRINNASYDSRGNFVSLTPGVTCGAATDALCFDELGRMTRSAVSTPAADFAYLYDAGGERVAKFSVPDGATRREFAKVIIEARGDTSLTCPAGTSPFADVGCDANPNDGKYVKKMKDLGITSGCGGGNYCPDVQTRRDQSSVFFLKGKHCAVNVNSCSYTPPSCTTTHVFNDVPCPPTPQAPFGDWIGQLYAEGITAGCGGNNFCPGNPLGSWQTLAWAQRIWPTYNPVPRNAILTYRDLDAHVSTEANQASSTGDASATLTYARDNVYLGAQLVASAVWAGATPNYQFYGTDHLGTPRLVTNVNASLVQLRKFWPYGDPGPTSGSESFQRLKLAGMERDDESKNYFDHARYESFHLGRFLSREPVWLGALEGPQTWNSYSYATDNPFNNVDEDGAITIPVAIAIGGGLYNGALGALEYWGEHPEASGWQLFFRGLYGFGTGFAGTLVAEAGVFANPVVGAAAGGALTSFLDQAGGQVLFGSHQPFSVGTVVLSGALGASSFNIARRLGPVRGQFEASLTKGRSIADFFTMKQVGRQTAQGLASAAIQMPSLSIASAPYRTGTPFSFGPIFGEAYGAFQLFLWDYQRQAAAQQTPQQGSPGTICVTVKDKKGKIKTICY